MQLLHQDQAYCHHSHSQLFHHVRVGKKRGSIGGTGERVDVSLYVEQKVAWNSDGT